MARPPTERSSRKAIDPVAAQLKVSSMGGMLEAARQAQERGELRPVAEASASPPAARELRVKSRQGV